MRFRQWKRILWLILVMCVLSGNALAEADAGDVQRAIVKTKSSPLSLRESPAQNGKLIAEIEKGETVTVLENGEWPLIEYEGKCGYVNGKYLQYEESKKSKYLRAIEYQKDNMFSKALELYRKLGDYEDAAHRIEAMEAAELYPMRKNNQYGLVNSNGKWIIAPKWDFITEARYISDNSYVFKVYDGEMFKSSTGVPISPIAEKGKWGVIDSQGKELIPCKWDSIEDIVEGYIFCYNAIEDKKNYTLYYYDGKDATIIADNYSYIGELADGYILFEEDETWGYLNQSGEQWKQYTDAYRFSEGLAAVQIEGEYGFIDTEGNLVLQPTWEEVTWFTCGLCPARKENKWGYIDKQGNWAITPQFDKAYVYQKENGLAIVEKGGKQWPIDTTGKQIGQKWDHIYSFHEDGTAIIKNNDKYGLIDQNGNLLISAKQEDLCRAMDGILFCYNSSNGHHYRSIDGKLLCDEKTIAKKTKLTGQVYFSKYTFFNHPVLFTNTEMIILNTDGSVFLREREL